VLAEQFLAKGVRTKIIGVPKTSESSGSCYGVTASFAMPLLPRPPACLGHSAWLIAQRPPLPPQSTAT
jgi:hypothetical protein